MAMTRSNNGQQLVRNWSNMVKRGQPWSAIGQKIVEAVNHVQKWSNLVGKWPRQFRSMAKTWSNNGQQVVHTWSNNGKKHGQRVVKHGQTWGNPVANWSTKCQNHQTWSEHSQKMIKQMVETWPRHGQHMVNTIGHTMVKQW